MITAKNLERLKELEEQFKGYTNRQISLINMSINEELQSQLTSARLQQKRNSRNILILRIAAISFGLILGTIVTVIVNLHFKG